MVTYRIDVLGVFGCYFFIILLHGACVAITVLNVNEEPLKEVHHDLNLMEFLRGFTKPFRSMDFRWLFFTRFLIQMGTITVQEYLQYDVLIFLCFDGAVFTSSCDVQILPERRDPSV
jgi:hypothetical protein